MTYVKMAPARRSNIDRNWNNFINQVMHHTNVTDEGIERVWRPRADIIENENEYKVLFDLPGIGKEDVEITIEDGVLAVSGERKREVSEDEKTGYRRERVFGKFLRKFQMENVIDAENISAKFENGVLEISLPKLEAAKPRKIEISAN